MMHSRFRMGVFSACLVGGVALLSTLPAFAATTIRVNSRCSLTQAVSSLNNLARPSGSSCEVGTGTGDTILLQASPYDVSARIVLKRSAVLKGAGRFATVVRGTSGFTGGDTFLQVEHTGAAGTVMEVTLQDLTLEGYDLPAPASGVWVSPRTGDRPVFLYIARSQLSGFGWSGIYAENAQLDVKDSMIAYNSSPSSGGGIYAMGGNFEVQRCAIINNRAFIGGGIYVSTPGNNNLRESTVSQNVATWGGGGVASDVDFYLNVHSSTIAFNQAEIGAGFWAMSQNSFQFLYSIVDANQALGHDGVLRRNDGYTEAGQTVVVESSLIGTSSGFTGSYNNSLKDTSAVLDPNIQDLGGATRLPVHRLRTGSPAIDYLPFSDVRLDQRGFPVPRPGGGATPGWDLGAYEHDPNWQTELLRLGLSSGDTLTKTSTSSGDGTSTSYSNQQGMVFAANAANDFVTFVVPVPSTRSYVVRVRARRSSNSGRFQLAVSDDQTFWTNVGGVVDLYRSSTDFAELTVNGSSPISLSGQKFFRFLVTGKNSASTGYKLDLDYIRLQ